MPAASSQNSRSGLALKRPRATKSNAQRICGRRRARAHVAFGHMHLTASEERATRERALPLAQTCMPYSLPRVGHKIREDAAEPFELASGRMSRLLAKLRPLPAFAGAV
eukprot:3508243-Pleurochrysis_carterae.AAC.2